MFYIAEANEFGLSGLLACEFILCDYALVNWRMTARTTP